MTPRKKTADAPTGASKRSTTEHDPKGAVMRVDNPMDLWYLCEKVGYAQRFPKIRSDGQPMYQRVVTQLIRLDDKLFDYHFPYIGEVGYDMTHSPPAPIMSRRQPHRPSEFPLGQYHAIKARLPGYQLNHVEVERTRELLSLGELEGQLNPAMRDQPGAAKALPDVVSRQLSKARGLFRIPDVIRIRDIALGGAAAFSQGNLQTVIEIKFDRDSLSDGQMTAYQKIAGHPKKFRLLETHTCQVTDDSKRDWIRDAMKEPVYRPVAEAGARGNLCLRPDIEAYPLLEGQVEQELQTLRHYLNPNPYPPLPAGPQLVPIDPTRETQRERERQQGQTAIGLALGGPLFAVGAAAVVAEVGGAAVLATGAKIGRDTALLGQVAGQTVRYTRQVVPHVTLGGSTYAMAEVNDQPSHNLRFDNQWLYDFVNDARTEQAYLYWPD